MPRKDRWLEDFGHLRGLTLHHRKYFLWAAHWDHDHCELCNRTFLVPGTPWATSDSVTEGWATEDEYDWVCDSCYAKHRLRFRWATREPIATDRPDTEPLAAPVPIHGSITKQPPAKPPARARRAGRRPGRGAKPA